MFVLQCLEVSTNVFLGCVVGCFLERHIHKIGHEQYGVRSHWEIKI